MPSGNRQVEGVVAVSATLVEFGEGALELFIGCVVVKGTYDESHALLELVPYVFAEGVRACASTDSRT